MPSTNWKKWCRLCAQTDGDELKLDTIKSVSDLLQKYFDISIFSRDDCLLVACKECLELVLSIEKFAVRCAKYNEMFWDLSEHDIKLSNIKTEQDGLSENDEFFPAHPSEATVDESFSSVQFLEVEIVKREHTESDVDCIESVCDTVDNLENNDGDYDEDALYDEILDKIEDSSDKCLLKNPTKRLPKKRTAKSIETLDFSCTKCAKRFVSKRSLKLHDIVHLPDDLKKIHSCPSCENKFQTISNLNIHFRAVHTEERPFVCEECGKSFVSVGGLNQHKVTHATDRPCQCPHCPKTFKDAMHLRKHEDVHNDGTHICLHCGKQLKSKRILRNHMIVHSDQKNYKCHLCDFEFKRSNTLKKHLLIHTGLRPFNCNFCDKTFTLACKQRYHEKTCHSKDFRLKN